MNGGVLLWFYSIVRLLLLIWSQAAEGGQHSQQRRPVVQWNFMVSPRPAERPSMSLQHVLGHPQRCPRLWILSYSISVSAVNLSSSSSSSTAGLLVKVASGRDSQASFLFLHVRACVNLCVCELVDLCVCMLRNT